ncbi:MAG: hypothetical protein ACLFRV_15190, partial [Acidimicrobiales bacterium]
TTMHPPALLPELVSRPSSSQLGHSALPDAPVRPHGPEPRLRRATRALQRSASRAQAVARARGAGRTRPSPVVTTAADPG